MKTTLCSRPLGITSISRTTMSGARWPGAIHAGGERELEFADAVGLRVNCAPPTRPDSTGTRFFGGVVVEREPIGGLQAEELTSPRAAGVVVDGDRNGDAIALGEGDGQIEIDEEVLEDFEAGEAEPSAPRLRGGEHGHAPGGDGVGDGDGDAGVAVAVGDDLGVDVEGFGEVGANMRSFCFVRADA